MTNLTEINTPTMNGPQFSSLRRVAVCDTQPVTAEGVRTLLAGSADMAFTETTDSLAQARDLVRRNPPDVLMLDKAFGIQAILEWLADLKASEMRTSEFASEPIRPTAIVIWGVSVSEAEALRFLQDDLRVVQREEGNVVHK